MRGKGAMYEGGYVSGGMGLPGGGDPAWRAAAECASECADTREQHAITSSTSSQKIASRVRILLHRSWRCNRLFGTTIRAQIVRYHDPGPDCLVSRSGPGFQARHVIVYRRPGQSLYTASLALPPSSPSPLLSLNYSPYPPRPRPPPRIREYGIAAPRSTQPDYHSLYQSAVSMCKESAPSPLSSPTTPLPRS